MAHSFVEAHDDEAAAFEHFARSRPQNLMLLIDTYDTEAAARKVVALAPRLKARGITIGAVRLDSGDLAALSRSVRRILDDGGLPDVIDLRQRRPRRGQRRRASLRAGAPIDGFGIGTSLTTSSDAPTLDCVYKLQEYAGLAAPQALGRQGDVARPQAGLAPLRGGRPDGGRRAVARGRPPAGEPLLDPVMQGGRRVAPSPTLADMPARAARELAAVAGAVARNSVRRRPYPVEVADALARLTREVDVRTGAAQRAGLSAASQV